MLTTVSLVYPNTQVALQLVHHEYRTDRKEEGDICSYMHPNCCDLCYTSLFKALISLQIGQLYDTPWSAQKMQTLI